MTPQAPCNYPATHAAAHILPWSGHEAERLNVRNGIALNRLHDTAFDQGLIAFDDDHRLLLSSHLKSRLSHEFVKSSFEAFEEKPLDLPADGIPPTTTFLAKHRHRLKVTLALEECATTVPPTSSRDLNPSHCLDRIPDYRYSLIVSRPFKAAINRGKTSWQS